MDLEASRSHLVDLSNVPVPEDALEHRSVQARLAPHLGVSSFLPQEGDPLPALMRSATARHGGAPQVGRCAAPVANSQADLILRGWYGTREEPRWCPCQSLFGGRAGRHGGVDLAAQVGTVLYAPLDGLAEFNPLGDGTSRGNHLFAFIPANPPLGVLLCHLKHPLGLFPRRVSAGEPIARAAFWSLRGRLQGASTIEQQLARTITGEKHICPARKIREILLAASVARDSSKRGSAQAYLGLGYYGTGMEGLDRAIRRAPFPAAEASPRDMRSFKKHNLSDQGWSGQTPFVP